MMKCAIGNPKRGKDRESMFFPQEKSEFEPKNTQENESRRLSAPVFGAYCLCSFHRCVLRGLGQETQGRRKKTVAETKKQLRLLRNVPAGAIWGGLIGDRYQRRLVERFVHGGIEITDDPSPLYYIVFT